jgi:hypothetical protein
VNNNKEVHRDGGSTYKSFLIRFPNTNFSYNPFTSIRVATFTRPRGVNRKTSYMFTQWFQIRLFDIHIEAPTFTGNHTNPVLWRVLLTDLHNFVTHTHTHTHARQSSDIHVPHQHTRIPTGSSTQPNKFCTVHLAYTVSKSFVYRKYQIFLIPQAC